MLLIDFPRRIDRIWRCKFWGERSRSREYQVSRKFLYQQADKARQALQDAFQSDPEEDEVLFYLPVTKAWLRQLVLTLILICHASYRGVIELFQDVLDTSISYGNVHNIVARAVVDARRVNAREVLSCIEVGAHDEIFQNQKPVLVGCDVASTYCYLLSAEEARDGTTWGVHLLDLQERGLHPSSILADFGKGLRAGQKEAWPEVPCRGDHFHILQDLIRLVTYLENRAFGAISATENWEQKMARAQKQAKGQALSKKLACARAAQDQAITLSDEVSLLVEWMRQDVLALVGPALSTRKELYDFLVTELRTRQHQVPHRIGPVVRKLENVREDLLSFAGEMDARLLRLAQETRVAPHLVRRLLDLEGLSATDPRRWQQEGCLRQKLGRAFYPLQQAIKEILASTVRASSVVENLNSRLRNYFFLRKHLGDDYLDLLRFFLNHRRFIRSHSPEREGKSPAEILTGKTHSHWLRLLGFQPFSKAA